MPDLLTRLDNATLHRSFDFLTVRRAQQYVAQGRVCAASVAEVDDGLSVVGQVEGSRARPYDVHVRILDVPPRPVLDARCSCPVAAHCKHGAALVLALRDRVPTRTVRPAWERGLATALDELDQADQEHPQRRPMALQFDLQRPRQRTRWEAATGPTVRVRPLQRGARDRWIKTGAGWHELAYAGYRGEHDSKQLAVLVDMHSSLSRFLYGNALPDLALLGPGTWPLLRRARDAGIEFVAAGGLSGVELCDEPVTLRADMVRRESGDCAVEWGVRHDGRWWRPGELLVLGRPGHGVALLRPQDPPRRSGPATVGLVLAPLTSLVPDVLRRMLDRGPLLVPDQDRSTFLADYLPRLRRHLPVGSSDGSVEVPAEVPPQLVLRLGWRGQVGTVGWEWQWCYGAGEAERRFGLVDTDGVQPVRSRSAERDLLHRLRLGPAEPVLCPDGVLLPSGRLTGSALVEFVDLVLPALRHHEDVRVEDDDDPPDFRPAGAAPELRFDVVQPAADSPDRTDWLDLEVRITVDGETLPLSTVLEALTLGRDRIFLPSGLHVAADHPAFARLAGLVRSAAELVDQPSGRLSVGRHDLGLWGELADLGVVDRQAGQWVRAAQALRRPEQLPDVEPPGLTSTLREYQLDGFRWLGHLWTLGLGGILADDMGLGKTLQTLALVAHARGKGAAPFLVVAPTSVVSAWQGEAARHTPGLVVRAVTAAQARRGSSIAAEHADADVVVTSYTLFRLEAEAYAALAWGGLVLDEAQQVKNHQGKTYHAVRRLDVPFRLALTGTPFENRLMELWSLLSIVAPGLYPWPKSFTEHVVLPVERRGDEAALDRFRRRIRPFLLRRTKELVAADLPAKQEQVLEVELNARHRRVYDTHLQRERQTVLGLVEDFDRNRVAIFSSLTRLRQLSLDAALVDSAHDRVGSAKLDTLVDHLVELAAEGHRALVFSQFTGFLGRVRDRLEREGIACDYLDGRTRARGEVIEGFKRGSAPVFLISLKAGGVGLTLTEADYVFVLDPWWNPAVEAQAVDRAHRIGQDKPVMVYRLVATDTIEEKVMALKARKAALFAQVVDGGGALATGITADDVRALFGP